MPNDIADTASLMREAIAARVRGLMAERRKTQRELGEVLGIPQSSVSLRLTGERAFRAEELTLIADFLGAPVEQLLIRPAVPASAA